MAPRATVYLVRHAKAGERHLWIGNDGARPLSSAGWKQADAVRDHLAEKATGTLISSPSLRCVQTLEPLGVAADTKVRLDDRLAEGRHFEPVLDLINEVPDRSVLCSHGDIIPAVIEALHRRGMELQTPPDWRKASIWVLRRKDARITKGKVWVPSRE